MKDLNEPMLHVSLPAGYVMTPRGIAVTSGKEQEVEHWLCSEIRVIGRCHRVDGTGWGRLAELRDPTGTNHTVYIAEDHSPSKIAKELQSRGLRVNRVLKGAERLLAALLSEWETTETYILADQLGWVDTSYSTYVFAPDHVIGVQKVYLPGAPAGSAPRKPSGSLAEWQSHVAAKCEGNTILTCAVSAAFAMPLAQLLDVDGFMLHFLGRSSSGKTTTLRVANSVWNSQAGVQTWRTKLDCPDTIASSASASLLVLDDLGQAEAEVFHAIGNGLGKQRARATPAQGSWCMIALSADEMSLAEKMSEAGKRTMTGQETRVIDVEADGRAFGLFDSIHGAPDGATFSISLREATERYYGTSGAAFVNWLCSLPPETKAGLKQRLGAFELKVVQGELLALDDAARRIARSLALIAMAGELASIPRITGWPESQALSAARDLFRLWLASKNRPIEAVVDTVACWLAANADSLVDLGSEKFSEGYGYKDEQHFYLTQEAWSQIFTPDQGREALRVLDAQGILVRDGAHYGAKMPRWAPKRERHYKLNAKRIAEFQGVKGDLSND